MDNLENFKAKLFFFSCFARLLLGDPLIQRRCDFNLLHVHLVHARVVEAATYHCSGLLELILLSELIIFESLKLIKVTVETVVVFDARVFELANLVELLKGHQLLRKVLIIELIKVFEREDAIFLQLPFQYLSQLLGSVVAGLEQLCCVLGSFFVVNVFILYDIDACLEETILLCSFDFLPLNNGLINLAVTLGGVLVAYWHLLDFAVTGDDVEVAVLLDCLRFLGWFGSNLRSWNCSIGALSILALVQTTFLWRRLSRSCGCLPSHPNRCSFSRISLLFLPLPLLFFQPLRLLTFFHFSIRLL